MSDPVLPKRFLVVGQVLVKAIDGCATVLRLEGPRQAPSYIHPMTLVHLCVSGRTVRCGALTTFCYGLLCRWFRYR